jgi:hypothetical protein
MEQRGSHVKTRVELSVQWWEGTVGARHVKFCVEINHEYSSCNICNATMQNIDVILDRFHKGRFCTHVIPKKIKFNSIYLHANLTAKGQLQSEHVK